MSLMDKLTYYGLISKSSDTPIGVPPFEKYVNDRLMTDGSMYLFGGLPLNGIFFFLAAFVTAAAAIFWMMMLVDCLKRRSTGKLLWAALLIVSLPFGLFWLTALLYYFLVKMAEDKPVTCRQRLVAALKNAAARLRRPRA